MPQTVQQPKDPYTAWLDSISAGNTDVSPTGKVFYKGFLTPFPDSWLPDWVKLGYNNSIEGLSRQIADGKPVYEVSKNYTPEMWGDIGATVISFSQPTDIAALWLGGGVGGLTLKAATKQAASAMIKSGIKKDIAKMAAAKGAQQFAKKIAFDKKAVMKYAASKQAGALGFYSGLQNTKIQQLTEGDMSWMETLEATAKGSVLGGITGGIGGKIATTALGPKAQLAVRLPTEAFAFGTVGPLLEGEMPSPTDYAHAAGVMMALTGSRFIKKQAINRPWSWMKKNIQGEVKKRQLSVEELQKQSEAEAKSEIGKDIWSDGEREVTIVRDFTNSSKVGVVELKDIKTGEKFQLGRNDFFLGARDEAGTRVTKAYQRLKVAGESLQYKEGMTDKEIDYVVQQRTFGLKDKAGLSDIEFKNMVDDALGRVQKPKYDGKRLKSGWNKLDTQKKHILLDRLAVREKTAAIKQKIVKLGGNEVYYHVSPLKENFPRIYKALQRIGAGVQTAQFQLSQHPIGRHMSKLMINTDASIGSLTGKYLTMIESVEIGKTKFGKSRKFFDMTEKEAIELANDLERASPVLPYTAKVKKLFDIMYAIAEQSGMPIREKINNYFPHIIKEGVLNSLQKDVDNMVRSAEILGKSNLQSERGVNNQIDMMIRSGELTFETVETLKHLRNKHGNYASAFENLRKGINSERYTINKHLEKGRELDLPTEFLERDARLVIPDYIQRWAKRVEYVKAFGVEGEKMFGNINTLQTSGFSKEARVLRDTFDSFTNLAETNPARNYRPSTKNFWNAMVNFGIGTKIGGGFAVFPNLGQPMISSALKAGIPRTILGLFRYNTDPNYKKMIKESGAMSTSLSVFQLMSGYRPTKLTRTGKIAEWLTRYFPLSVPFISFDGPKLSDARVRLRPILSFQSVNRNNQIISAVAGYEGMRVWRKWAKGEGVGGSIDFVPGISNRLRSVENLNQMGLIENYEQYKRDLTSGKITEKQFFDKVNRSLDRELKDETKQREAVYRFAIDTQLQRNILREPVYFNDPRFRPFILFKRFGYRQFEWIYKNTLQEIKAGNAVYILRLMAGGLIYGPLLNSAKRMLRDVLAGEPIYDESYSVTEVIEDFDNIKSDIEQKGLSTDTFLNSAVKNISMGDLLDSFAAIGAAGFVGDITSALYDGEKKLIRAGEFFLKPAVLQDMLVGADTATRFLRDYGDYGFKNSLTRVPQRLAPAFGTFARQAATRLWTPGQKETYQKYRRGQIKSDMLDAFLDGDDDKALQLLAAWNRANPDRPFSYNDISWKAMWDKAERKAKKRLNP
jgi:hypothetical protein|tara:strand:- start:332 stop:4237 length:3906 start_codon:yes stop_codon:yes gene_type:complete